MGMQVNFIIVYHTDMITFTHVRAAELYYFIARKHFKLSLNFFHCNKINKRIDTGVKVGFSVYLSVARISQKVLDRCYCFFGRVGHKPRNKPFNIG